MHTASVAIHPGEKQTHTPSDSDEEWVGETPDRADEEEGKKTHRVWLMREGLLLWDYISPSMTGQICTSLEWSQKQPRFYYLKDHHENFLEQLIMTFNCETEAEAESVRLFP